MAWLVSLSVWMISASSCYLSSSDHLVYQVPDPADSLAGLPLCLDDFCSPHATCLPLTILCIRFRTPLIAWLVSLSAWMNSALSVLPVFL